MDRLTQDASAFLVKTSADSSSKTTVALGLDFDTMPNSQLTMWFNAIYPIGSCMILGSAKKPDELTDWPFVGLGTWEPMSSDTTTVLGLVPYSAGSSVIGKITGTNKTKVVTAAHISKISITTSTVSQSHSHTTGTRVCCIDRSDGLGTTQVAKGSSGKYVPSMANKNVDYKNYGIASASQSHSHSLSVGSNSNGYGPDLDIERYQAVGWVRTA